MDTVCPGGKCAKKGTHNPSPVSLCILDPPNISSIHSGQKLVLGSTISARVGGNNALCIINVSDKKFSFTTHFPLRYLVHKFVTREKEKSKLDSRKKSNFDFLAFLTIFHTKGNRSSATGIFWIAQNNERDTSCCKHIFSYRSPPTLECEIMIEWLNAWLQNVAIRQ